MLIEAQRDGVFAVRRRAGEPPFAELHAPRATGVRHWGVKYRGPGAPHPFGTGFNVMPATREAAMQELEDTVRVCSDYQLCVSMQD